MGGGFAPKKPVAGSFGKPKAGAPAPTTKSNQITDEIGANALIELSLEAEETMIEECEDEDVAETANVSFLP